MNGKNTLLAACLLGLVTGAHSVWSNEDVEREKLKQEIKAEVLKELNGKQAPEAPKSQKEGLWVGDKLKFSGQVRVRPEFRRNLRQAALDVPAQVEENASFLLRTRFGMEFFPVDHVSFFIQGQDSREFGEEAAAVPTAVGDDEGLELHQGFIDLTDIGNKPFHVRAGRQEINLGEQRLVGAVNWSNVGRAFDGLLLSYEPERWGLKAFAAVTDRTGVSNLGDGQYFGGLYGTWKKFPGGVLDGYYLILQDNDGAAAGAGDTQSVHTVGARIKAKYENGIDFGVESAVQLGKFGSNGILAFAEHVEAGYTFSPAWKPRIGAEYNYATGDDPASARYTKFNNLFPTNHDKYGYIDWVTWSNMHAAAVGVSFKPGEQFHVEANYHALWVDKNGSAGDTFATYAGGAGIGKMAGHEVDLLGKWAMNRHFDALAGYSHLIPGAFLKDRGVTSHSDFFYLQAQAQF